MQMTYAYNVPKKSLIKNGSSLNSKSPQLQYREVQGSA